MTKQDMADKLFQRIKTANATGRDSISLRLDEACRIIELLTGAYPEADRMLKDAGKDNESILFFCQDCEKSFRTNGREDPECLKKWHYRAWYANCPYCGKEVRQTDRYWR